MSDCLYTVYFKYAQYILFDTTTIVKKQFKLFKIILKIFLSLFIKHNKKNSKTVNKIENTASETN